MLSSAEQAEQSVGLYIMFKNMIAQHIVGAMTLQGVSMILPFKLCSIVISHSLVISVYIVYIM